MSLKAIVKATHQPIYVEHYMDSTTHMAVTTSSYTDGITIYNRDELIFPDTEKADQSLCINLAGEFQDNGYAKCRIGGCGIGSACACYPNKELMECCANYNPDIKVGIAQLKEFLKEYDQDKNLMSDDFDVDDIIFCLRQSLNKQPWKKKDLKR